MKAAILLVFLLALAGGHAAAAFTPERLREIFSFDSRSPEDDEQLFNMVSREELVEWARIGLTRESPASLALLISITGSRYQRYSDDLTDREKDEIVDCIIKTSERHIALTGSYGSLGKLGAFVHPKIGLKKMLRRRSRLLVLNGVRKSEREFQISNWVLI